MKVFKKNLLINIGIWSYDYVANASDNMQILRQIHDKELSLLAYVKLQETFSCPMMLRLKPQNITPISLIVNYVILPTQHTSTVTCICD